MFHERTLTGTPRRPLAFGLDIDGTITAAAEFFSFLTQAAKMNGIPVHVITSRSRQARRTSLDELTGLGIHFDADFFLPSIEDGALACPHTDLDWYERYLWNKVAYAKQHRLTHVFEDDPKVLALFERFAPDVTVFRVEDIAGGAK